MANPDFRTKLLTKSQRTGFKSNQTFRARQTAPGMVQPAAAPPLPPNTPFTISGGPAGFTFGDLASWALSDLRDNVARGFLAEYLVAKALGLAPPPRRAWDEADLWLDGTPIHVKASPYLQSWAQAAPSKAVFSNLRPRRPRIRESIFVLCLNTCPSHAAFTACRLDDWVFFPLSGTTVADLNRSSLSLARVQTVTAGVGFAELQAAVGCLRLGAGQS